MQKEVGDGELEEKDRFMKMPCSELVHPFCPHSCLKAYMIVFGGMRGFRGDFEFFKDGFVEALKVHAPLFIASSLLNKNHRNLEHFIKKVVPKIVRSSGLSFI
jgi:hypothetical protein